jgi:GT2 family glycosyltransferase
MAMTSAHACEPLVTVIVPVYNDVTRLRECLQALAVQNYPRGRLDVVVVDNASTQDPAAAIPTDPRFTLISEAQTGSYAARNRGLSVATGEVLAFTDSDCTPDPDWISRGVAALTATPRAELVGGDIELTYANGRPLGAAELYESRHGFPQEAYLRAQQFAATANMLTWRRVFDAIGPFDANLQSGGDVDFGRRVARAGGRLRFAPDAVVRHPARSSNRELIGKFVRITKGEMTLDRARGAGRLHFLRLAARQGKLFALRAVGVLLLQHPPRGVGKFRYLALYARLRWVQARLYLSATITG